MKTRTLLMLLSLILLAGCLTPPQANQVQRLLAHPQFPAARQAAPVWAKDALTTINDLQRENSLLKTQPLK